MRKLVLISLLLFTAMATAGVPADSLQIHMQVARPHQDLWFAKDKGDHFLVSAFLTGAGYYAARSEMHRSDASSLNVAVGFSLSMGIGKELYDRYGRGGPFSLKDLGADVLGIGLGYLFCTLGKK